VTGERDDGLPHALLLDGRGGARSLDPEGLAAWQPEHGALWVHADLTHETGRAWIAQQSGLDPLAVDALLDEDTRPRERALDDALLFFLRGVNLNPGQDPEDMVSIRLWMDGRRIVSARHRVLLSVRDVVDRLAAGKGPVTAGALLADLVERIVERIDGVVDTAQTVGSEIEEAVIADADERQRTALADLRRQVIALRRYLAPQREACSRLQRESFSWLGETDKARLGEATNQLIRCVEDLDAVRDRAGVTTDQIDARLSEQLNRRMYALAIITAVFLPLTFLTGLLGVNLGGIPGAENELGFAIFGSGLILAGVVVGLLFRRSRWF
jgi:zinc transporter